VTALAPASGAEWSTSPGYTRSGPHAERMWVLGGEGVAGGKVTGTVRRGPRVRHSQ